MKGESLKDKGGEKGDFLKMGAGDRKDQREIKEKGGFGKKGKGRTILRKREDSGEKRD